MKNNHLIGRTGITLALFSIVVLLVGGATAVRGQSALDGFDPSANGTVQVVVAQPDGKISTLKGLTTLQLAALPPINPTSNGPIALDAISE